MSARLLPALACVATLALGLGARAVLAGLPAKVLGVALYATLIYALVVLVAPRVRIGRALIAAVLVCFAIELFQLTSVPAALAPRHVLFRLVLGTTFSAWDLPMYVAGALLGAGVHGLRRRRAPRR